MFDIRLSLQRAEARLGRSETGTVRARRTDAGAHRLPGLVAQHLTALLAGEDRPRPRDVLSEVSDFCRAHGLAAPARATVYAFMRRTALHFYPVAELPPAARAALYNLDDSARVPGHQLAFFCFNHGDLRAAMFAATLPWIDLYQARTMRGWRARSRGLLEAVLRARGIIRGNE